MPAGLEACDEDAAAGRERPGWEGNGPNGEHSVSCMAMKRGVRPGSVQDEPTWSRGPEDLFLLSMPRGLSPPRAPPPSTSMPCDLAEMPAPRRALATTRAGAAAAPRMEMEDAGGLLAIAASAWYAAMGGEGELWEGEQET